MRRLGTRRIVSGGKAGPVSSLNVGGPQAGLASGAPTGAPPAAGPAQPPEEPDFLDRAGKWIDKHQQGIMTGLSFIGNMLGSKSHQLTGAIGEGLYADGSIVPPIITLGAVPPRNTASEHRTI